MSEITFVHFSDTHIVAASSKPFMGLNAYQRAVEALEMVKAGNIDPAFFVISGDLCHDANVEDYQQLQAFVNDIRVAFDVPVLLALGNHDRRIPFRTVFLGESAPTDADAYFHSQIIAGVRVIVLDSHVPVGQAQGAIDPIQLRWLADQFAQDALTETLIVVHHPPFQTGMSWLDTHVLTDVDAVADILAGKPILGILSGHVHMNLMSALRGIPCVAGTGLAFTLDPLAPEGVMTLLDGSGFNVVRIQDHHMTVTNVPMQRGGAVLYSATREQMVAARAAHEQAPE